MRYFALAFTLLLAACSKPAPGFVRLNGTANRLVSLGVFDPNGTLLVQPLEGRHATTDTLDVDCSQAGPPPGTWAWRAVAFGEVIPEQIGTVAAGVAEKPGDIAGGDKGPPCAVAADEVAVYLGWRAAEHGHEVVAVEPGGRVLWGFHRGPGLSGVTALAADGGFVFVLDGEVLYKLNAKTGERVPFGEKEEISLVSLWPENARVKPARGDALAADNGRVYVTFGADEFIAALDAETGAYVITLSGPAVGQLSLSQTPMRDPETGITRPIDFGVAAIGSHGLAYFLMDHEPAWVMGSVTRWLQPEEQIVALTTRGDTMKTDKVMIYTAIGAPQHQVQLRPAEAAEGFDIAVGKPGGRPTKGPWVANALRDVRALAVDATGHLWIAEGDEKFGRFSVWKTEGKEGVLLREIFGPLPTTDLVPSPADPHVFELAGHRWKLDPATKRAAPIEILKHPALPAPLATKVTDSGGLVLWTPPADDQNGPATFLRTHDDRHWGYRQTELGLHVFALPGLDQARMVGSGQITIQTPK